MHTKNHTSLLLEELVFGAVLGKGTYGVVVQTAVPKLGVQIAVKLFNPTSPSLFHEL